MVFALDFSLAALECEVVAGTEGRSLQVDLLVRQLFDVEPFVSGHIFKLLRKSVNVPVMTRLRIIIALFQRHARLHLRKIESVWK